MIDNVKETITAETSAETTAVIPMYGWVCPTCRRVYSPFTTMCHYCGNHGRDFVVTSDTSEYETHAISDIKQILDAR